MLKINKIRDDHVIDYAAEELKKYLRMMMPECGDIEIKRTHKDEDSGGFRLGLMSDFGLDFSDAEDPELDDILYIDTDCFGGIIAGDNPRSVLLSVYEYLRHNGCRWLYPGIDGEYIPMHDTVPVKYRHKPSCRYRGQCNEGAESQTAMMESIEFAPKLGMNVYMLEFKIPRDYYASYYNHKRNEENRKREPVTDVTVLQWKRQCEAEIAKRGLQFHDVGHGFTVDPFGINSADGWDVVPDDKIPADAVPFLAMTGGVRHFFGGQAINTQFCMSNPEGRRRFVNYVADYAENHTYVDYLHVWLADAYNNHCECEACAERSVSDWYMILMNEIDRELTRRSLVTRIVFIVYLDTTWAPLTERIENPERFTLLLAPITRSYTHTLNEKDIPESMPSYPKNELVMPKDLEEYFYHFLDWKCRFWSGSNLCYEYHFWRHQYYDVGGIELAKRINEDIKVYKKYGINGVIEDGSQRSFFPNGFAFYTYARTLFDTSLSVSDIAEDYFPYAYGEDWRLFYSYLDELGRTFDFAFMEGTEPKHPEISSFYDPKHAEVLEKKIPELVKRGRELILKNYDSECRVQTVSARLLEFHCELTEGLAEVMAFKARGLDREANGAYNRLRIECGKREIYFERYYDHHLAFFAYSTVMDNKTNITAY